MRYFIWFSVLTLAGVACHGPSGSPPFDRSLFESKNVVSKPAIGSVDEGDPKLSLPERVDSFADVNIHADQCRSVLGPFPTVSCPDSPIVPTTFRGKRMTYENGIFYEEGKPTAWRPEDGCDHPGLISMLFATTADSHAKEGCLPNARLGSQKNGPVTWAWTCHFVDKYHEKTDKFDFVTLIGSNSLTGETCFFSHSFGGDDARRTTGKDIVPPGGWHVTSESERLSAKKFWDGVGDLNCLGCHGSNHPWLITPHTNQKRVKGDGSMELLPEMARARRREPGKSFRIIGTVHNFFLPPKPESWGQRPMAIYPKNDDGTPDTSCTRCHVLTDQENFLRLARLSVGLGDLPKVAEKTKDYVRDPKPWMPPNNDGSPAKAAAARAAVLRFERAFYDPKWRAKEAVPILSPCPTPAALPAGNIAIARQDAKGGVAWTYRNDYGQVPLRDDVRFEITVRGSDGRTETTKDIAPDTLGSERWHFVHARKPGVSYTYSLRPFRYCFDETGYRYAEATAVTE